MNISGLLKHVMPSVKGCPEPLAEHHILQALIEFCEGTLAWNQWLTDVPSVAEQTAYALVLPAGSALVKLVEFKVGGVEADVVTPGKGRGMLLHESGAQVAWTTDRVTFNVSPAPAADDIAYSLRAALKPTQAATTVDDTLAEHYATHIADGALARLLEIEGVPWENQQRAAVRRGKFEDAIGTVGARVAKGFSSAQRRSKPLLY